MMILHKCKINFLIIFVTSSCKAYDNFYLESETTAQWLSVFSLSNNSHTAILNVEGIEADSSVTLSDFIKSTSHEHSVLIISGQEMPAVLTLDKLTEVVKQRVNLVLSIKYINSSLLDCPMLKFMLNSPWSVLLIIVTTKDTRYRCDQGNLTEEASNDIETYMNDLWRKYRMMIVILTLPYICPNHYVVFHGSKPTNEGVYNRTIKLINATADLSKLFTKKTQKSLTRNYPLRGNIFGRFPTAITNCSGTEIYVRTSDMLSGGYCGMDGLVMTDVVRHFGFNLTTPFLGPDNNKYGYLQENGVVTGSLAYVMKGGLDISFNSRFMVTYVDSRSYNFLSYVSQDSLCFLMKRPAEQPIWLYPCGSYTFPKLFLIISSLTIVGVFMWITARIESKMHDRKESSLIFYIRNAIIAGLFGFFLTRRNDLFIYRWLCLFVSIALLAIYQSYINNWFTTRWYDYMTTLSDLVEFGTVIQTSPTINALLEIPANDVQAALLSRKITVENTNSFDYVLKHPNTATLERQSDATMLTLMQYVGEEKPPLYVVNQCLRNFYLSYITNEKFPFTEHLHVFMMRLVESGLPEMYYIWTSRSIGLQVTLPNMASEPRPADKVTLGAQFIAFGLLFIGYFLSTIILAIEIYVTRRHRPYPYIP